VVAGADTTLDEYVEQLARRLETLDLRGISGPGARTLPLDDVYVVPRLKRIDGEAQPRREALGDVWREQRCLVVASEPGGGKSTLLRAVCLALARPGSDLSARIGVTHPAPLVPILLRLADFSPRTDQAHEVPAFVRSQLAASFSAAAAAAVDAARDRWLLCLDGLDEIPRDADRRRAARAIEAWATTGRCWVSVRTAFEPALIEPFVRYRLEPFDDAEVSQYLERRAALAGDSAAGTRELWRALRCDGELAEVTSTPLLLVLALGLGGGDRGLPTDRVRLYHGVFDTLVRSWNEDRRRDALQPTGEPVDPGDLLRAWAEVAVELLARGRLDQRLHRRQLERQLALHFPGAERERCDRGALL
jgi:hypothetical protein